MAKHRFGVRKADSTDTGGKNGGSFIKYMSKNGEVTLRFLDDLPDWTEYYEHFSAEKKAAYPCTGRNTNCPGCNSDDPQEVRAAKRYLTNAFDESTGYVNLWKIPKSALTPLERFYDRDETLFKRPFTLIRYEQDDWTKYTFDREDREDFDREKYADQMKDHQEALEEAWMYANDEAYRAERLKEAEDRKKDKDDKEAAKGDAKSAGKTTRTRRSEPDPEPVDEEQADEDDDEDEITEDELRQMPKAKICALLRENEIEFDRLTPKSELVDLLLDNLADDE